jgi:hypothetical protein
MPSSGTGSDISEQDLADLLHKLITESTKVQAMFSCPSCGVRSKLRGVVRLSPDDTFCIEPEHDGLEFMLSFDPFLAVIRKYGDERSMTNRGELSPDLQFASILSFAFADGSTLALFAVKEE